MTNAIPRSTRRKYLTKTSQYKRIKSLRVNHPERIAFDEMMRKNGEEVHAKNVEAIQQALSESLSGKETLILETLKSKGLEKAEIDSYMEKWVDVNFWPKPSNYYQTRKDIKKLNKKYGI